MSDTEELIARLDSIEHGTVPDAASRERLVRAAQALAVRLETPWEFVHRTTWQEPAFLMCLKIADDVGLFEHIGNHDSDRKSLSFLAAATSMDEDLLKGVLRHLAAHHVLVHDNATPGKYGATHISEDLATREAGSYIRHSWDVYFPCILDAPKLFKENGYQMPTDSRNGIYQQHKDIQGLTSFEYFQRPENKHIGQDFNLMMKYINRHRPSFVEVCNPGVMLDHRSSSNTQSDYLFVDIGGGLGHNTLRFRKHFSDHPGLVELQDLRSAIDTARAAGLEDQGVSLRAHSFFDAQPAKGSRFYFLSSVLHDWPDADAKKILRNVREAMTPGYSTLLINEYAIPEVGCHAALSALDLSMVIMLAAKERTEGEWQSLLGSVGLKLVKIHSASVSAKSILECEIAPDILESSQADLNYHAVEEGNGTL